MEIKTFIENFRHAFGERAALPIAVWYSDAPVAATGKSDGCIFLPLNRVAAGETVSLNAENIGCGGGKFYCGYGEMPERVPNFVSLKERYKRTSELVREAVRDVPRAERVALNLARIDTLETFGGVEGLIFFATPDQLSGLAAWAFYDRNDPDTVSALFGSGCSSVITQVVAENARGGYRSFLGFFDPSARIHIDSDLLSFAIPMSRFRVMYETMPQSCLFDTHAWSKIRERMNG